MAFATRCSGRPRRGRELLPIVYCFVLFLQEAVSSRSPSSPRAGTSHDPLTDKQKERIRVITQQGTGGRCDASSRRPKDQATGQVAVMMARL